ncbi:MAG: DUF2764 family protein [Bacteroidales bacterium]|jgi:hypothetical protein|nr:DUF2764 family protein [Bacteroidales bacterium]
MYRRNYYYLVAGMPDIVFEQSKLSVTLSEFKMELKANLHSTDYKLVELLFLEVDNNNVLNLLTQNIDKFDSSGKYSFYELEEEIKEPKILPSYLKTFITSFKTDQPIRAKMSWEDQLATLYYEYLFKTKNEFLRDWFELECNIRNILAGFTARRHKIPVEHLLVGDNYINNAIRKSNAADFGLQDEFFYIDKLIQINEYDNLLDRERAIDQLKWNYLDEQNTFRYFSIEVILAFVIKMKMVERWLKLDKKTGEEMFRKLIKDLENSYKFSKEFNI